jgi:hypothetical protein
MEGLRMAKKKKTLEKGKKIKRTKTLRRTGVINGGTT